jgi:putative colanic acid biosynthesis acetyltransferase WcaB
MAEPIHDSHAAEAAVAERVPCGSGRDAKPSILSIIREDWRSNPHIKSKFVLALFRLAHASYMTRSRIIRKLTAPYRLLYRLIVDWTLGIDIPCKVVLGRRAVFYHSIGIVINEGVKIGDDCIFRHGVTIGNKLVGDVESAPPTIGNGVEFGVGAIVIGDISVGDRATIGAAAVVTRSVAPRAIVVGNPAREIARHAL